MSVNLASFRFLLPIALLVGGSCLAPEMVYADTGPAAQAPLHVRAKNWLCKHLLAGSQSTSDENTKAGQEPKKWSVRELFVKSKKFIGDQVRWLRVRFLSDKKLESRLKGPIDATHWLAAQELARRK